MQVLWAGLIEARKLFSLPPLRGKMDRGHSGRETDEGAVAASPIAGYLTRLNRRLIRRYAPPSPARGEGERRA
jgi:hypothetical protein